MTAPVSLAGEDASRRRARRGVAVAVIGLLALGACTSDPGPKRVAQDIIKAESLANPELDEECLLARLEDYRNQDLIDIADGLARENSADQVEAESALEAYQADLETCN